MVSNIFAYFLSPAKLLQTSPLQFCPLSVSWRKDMELARAWRIIFPQLTVMLPGERRKGTGSQSLPFTSKLHPHWQVWPYFHHFLGSLEVHHQIGLLARSHAGAAAPQRTRRHSSRSSPSLLPLRSGQSPHQLPHTQGHDPKSTTFKTFLGNTDCWQRLWGNLNLRWGWKLREASFKERFSLAISLIWGLIKRRTVSVTNFYRVWNITGY